MALPGTSRHVTFLRKKRAGLGPTRYGDRNSAGRTAETTGGTSRRERYRALFMDMHKGLDGLTAEAVARGSSERPRRAAQARREVPEVLVQRKGGNRVLSLGGSQPKRRRMSVHREAHGLLPVEIVEVKEGR